MIELALGLVLSMTSGMGYSSPSYGLSTTLDSNRLRLIADIFAVEKKDGGNGVALHTSIAVRALGGDRCGVWVGADAVGQSVDMYNDGEILPMVEIASRGEVARIEAHYLHGTGHDIRRVIGVGGESRGRVRMRGVIEHVEHEQGSGMRYVISVLARVK